MTVTAIPQTAGEAPAETQGEPPRRSRKKLLVVLLVLVLGGGAAYWFLRPHEPEAPKPGHVVALEPIQINLAGEHYLRMGIALQLPEAVEEVDGSKALDAAIDEFSGRPMAEVTDPGKRRALKSLLEAKLAELYDDEVMGVYFTQFVTQ